jgi:hypothetical protein
VRRPFTWAYPTTMSVESWIDPRSRKYTVGPVPKRTGVSSNSWRSLPRAALVLAILRRLASRTLPEGSTVVALFTASITSSGERPYSRNFSGSTVITMLRWLPPKGGGAETPGRVAKIGLTRLRAMSCIWPGDRVELENTS